MNIHSTEMDDYKNLLKEAGYNIDDFAIDGGTSQKPYQSEINAYLGEIEVRRHSNGISRVYRVDYPSKWLSAFELDLKSNYFG